MSAPVTSTLTPELAQTIARWANQHFRWQVSLEKPALSGFLLPEDQDARTYLLARCRNQDLFLTARGWALAEKPAQALIAQTAALAEQLPKGKAEDFGDLKAALEKTEEKDKPAPPPLQVPPDGVLWRLCDGAIAKQRLDDQGKSSSERKRILGQLVEQPERWLPKTTQAHIDAVNSLAVSHPNFEPAIRCIVQHLHLLRLGQAPLRLPPMLLLGPPGVGKTHFARGLARVLTLHLRIHSLADASAGWILTGLHHHWADSAPGVIAKLMIGCPLGQAPMVLLDELDKASGDRRYPCDIALLGLLEAGTARIFRDENLDLELDASPVSYLLTANRLGPVRPEILSRMKVIEIPPPSPEQMPALVRSVDAEIRSEFPELDRAFDPLDETLVDRLGACPPRDLKRLLQEGYARVAERELGRSEGLQLQAEDLGLRVRSAASPPEPYVIPILVEQRPPWRLH